MEAANGGSLRRAGVQGVLCRTEEMRARPCAPQFAVGGTQRTEGEFGRGRERERMVERLLKSPFGHFEPAFRLFYEHAGALYFEGERLPADSCEGAQQGDPLGPFIFALAFHATLQQVAAEYTDCVFVAYLDDVTVLGPPARAYTVK